MRKFLNIKIPIPYELVEGEGTISKKKNMNEIQKRIAAMFVAYKELDIEELTLPAAIEKVLGIKKFYQKIIANDIKDLIGGTCLELEYKPNILFGIYAYAFNDNIKKEIVDNNMYFMAQKETFEKKVSILLSQFENIKNFPHVDKSIFLPIAKKIKFKPTLEFNKIQKEDYVSAKINEKINKKEEIIISESEKVCNTQIVWIEHPIQLIIDDDPQIKVVNKQDEHIWKLIDNENILINIEEKINNKINLAPSKELDGDYGDINFFINNKNIIQKLDFLDHIFMFSKTEIIFFGYKIITKKIITKKIELKFLTSKKITIFEFIKQYGNKLQVEFIFQQTKKIQQIILKEIFKKEIFIDQKKIMEILKKINIELIRSLDFQTLKNIYENENYNQIIIENIGSFFEFKDILKYFELTKEKEEDVIEKFNVQYIDSPLFLNWKPKKKMFQIIQELKKINFLQKNPKELEEILKQKISEIDPFLKNQNIIIFAIKNFKNKIEQAIISNKNYIQNLAIQLTNKMKINILKLEKNIDYKNELQIIKILNNNIIDLKSKKLINIWQTLNKLNNKYISKELSNFLETKNKLEIFKKELDDLFPFVKNDFKKHKGEKNVT